MEKENTKKYDINQTTSASEHTVASENNKYGLFTKIPEMVNKYGKGTMAFSVIIFILILNLVINPINFENILNKWVDNQENIHQQGVQKREIANLTIPPILNNILLNTGGDRIMILEFHNGGLNNSSLPFFHFSAYYEEVSSPDTECVSDQYKQQNTVEYATIIQKLKFERDIYYPNIDNIFNDKAVNRMKKNNVKSAYLCGIYDDNGKLMGIMTLTSGQENKFTLADLHKHTINKTQQIGHLLTGITNVKLK